VLSFKIKENNQVPIKRVKAGDRRNPKGQCLTFTPNKEHEGSQS
jgi:hypothetical protein